ncbi:MAG TPA: hypothetical protein PLI09_20340 [Candidatus Hydrogenedentes bacterium]|nr:hypothetical protein [Candidatus Hydrogenedentota bacterium]
MNEKHVIEELSAYIDGEAPDPARIARHLQVCESCARHHMQLLKLSTHLHAMPMPAPRQEFLTRVMAHVAEEPVPSAGWWNRISFATPAWALGMVVLLVITALTGAWLYGPPSTPEPTQHIAQETIEPVLAPPDPSPMEDVGSYSADTAESVSYDELLAMLAEASVEEAEMSFFYDESDLDDQLEALDEQEIQALREVLSEYLQQSYTENNEG